MKIAIVGWGLEGQSAYRYFGPSHEYLIVNEAAQDNFPVDKDNVKVQYLDSAAPFGIAGQVKDLSYLDGIENCDKIVYQPTAYFNLMRKFRDDQAFWAKATTAYDIFFDNTPTRNIIGITGTKGKGTTTVLIAEMLKAVGQTVHVGGNIGTPILDILPNVQPGDWVVWEMANFQLKPAHHSPHVAVCLMIVPDHLDWHPDMDDYISAKSNIFRYQKPTDYAIYFADNEISTKLAQHSPGRKVPYYQPPGAYVKNDGDIVVDIGKDETTIINKKDVRLLGEHNLQNICAAATVMWSIAPRPEAIAGVLQRFTGLEHRLEFVRDVQGVKYYDDSFSTTPDTTIVAMNAFTQPKIVILGGHDKGIPFDKMADAVVKSNVRHAIVIGQTAPKIVELLKVRGFNNITAGLQEMSAIVAAAHDQAQSGDVVLLSCGCSSFGLFKDYKERGDRFKQAVMAL